MSYYRPQSSCGKVMFLHLSVILFTAGGCLPDTPQIRGRHHLDQRQTSPVGRHGHCSGRYASHCILVLGIVFDLAFQHGGNKRNLMNCCFRDSFFVRDLLPCTFGKRAFYIPADLKVCILIGGS